MENLDIGRIIGFLITVIFLLGVLISFFVFIIGFVIYLVKRLFRKQKAELAKKLIVISILNLVFIFISYFILNLFLSLILGGAIFPTPCGEVSILFEKPLLLAVLLVLAVAIDTLFLIGIDGFLLCTINTKKRLLFKKIMITSIISMILLTLIIVLVGYIKVHIDCGNGLRM